MNKSGSGTTITDTQAVINKALDAVGTTEADATPNNYSSANFVTNGDNRKVAIGKLDTQLKTTNDNVNAAIASNTSQDTRLTNLESNNMTIAGNKTFSGNTVFSGDVTVNGTTTTINSTTQDVVDPNITVNKGGTNLTSEGAGITVDRAGTKGSIIYKNASATKFAIGNLASEVNIVDESTAQTLSNKNFPYSDYLEQGSDPSAPAATYRRIYSKADGFYQRDSAGVISKVGTGSGSGGAINLVTNGDADSAIATIFVPYQDSSGTRPIDGTGGTTTGITTALTATAPLSGTNSFTLTKDAANRQGGGWSAPFTVDLAYRAKSLKISVDYIVNSGTFVSGSSSAESDVIFYLYDVTNSQLIEPSNIKLFASSTSTSDKYEATFQTSATGSSYRLIAHIQSVSALAYELKVDNISVAPSQYVYAAPITDWIDYTPTITSFSGTLTNYTLANTQYSRVGSNLYIKGSLTFTGAAGTWARPRVSLPSGLVIDNGVIAVQSGVTFSDTGTNRFGSDATLSAGTSFIQFETYRGTASAGVAVDPTQAAPFAWGSTDRIDWVIGPIKISGWTANTQVSDGYDAREVSFNVSRATNLTGINPNNSTVKIAIAPGTIAQDSVSGWNSGSNRYDIKTAGIYDFNLQVGILNTNVAATNYYYVAIYKNGTQVANGTQILTSSAGQYMNLTATGLSIPCSVNDYIEAYISSTANHSASTLTATSISFAGNKHQAPTTISMSEEVSLRYTSTSGAVIGTTPSTYIYGTRDYDSHNAYNASTGEFKPPVPGRYRIMAKVRGTYTAAANDLFMSFYVNGVSKSQFLNTVGAGSGNATINFDTLNLLSSDVVTIRPFQTVSSASSTSDAVLTIERVK